MLRSVFSVFLLITLVTLTNAGGGWKKKIFKKYAMGNLWEKCIGEQELQKYVVEMIKAAKKCHSREFDAAVQPVYIRPYPQPSEVNEMNPLSSKQAGYLHKLNMGHKLLHMAQQRPLYGQPPMYRQPPLGYQQPFYGYQPQYQNNQLYRQKRAEPETPVTGEAELYYYNKLKKMMKNKVGNFSCMMHEMGYFTEDNQVDVEKYKSEINAMKIDAVMKEEFINNVDLCQEVADCLPEKMFTKYPYGKEYGRSFFFVMCEKKKSAETCLKKQMVDDYYKYKDLMKDGEIPDMDEDNDLFSMGF